MIQNIYNIIYYKKIIFAVLIIIVVYNVPHVVRFKLTQKSNDFKIDYLKKLSEELKDVDLSNESKQDTKDRLENDIHIECFYKRVHAFDEDEREEEIRKEILSDVEDIQQGKLF